MRRGNPSHPLEATIRGAMIPVSVADGEGAHWPEPLINYEP